jgi:hypothetical protein
VKCVVLLAWSSRHLDLQVPAQNIISVHNVSEIYKVPLVLQKQNVAEIISDKLQMYLPKGMPNINEWEQLCRKLDGVEQKVPSPPPAPNHHPSFHPLSSCPRISCFSSSAQP